MCNVVNYSGDFWDLVGYSCGNCFEHGVRNLGEAGGHGFLAFRGSDCDHVAVGSGVAFDACGFGVR